MGIDTRIISPGSQRSAEVTASGSLQTALDSTPIFSIPQKIVPLIQYLTLDGTEDGTSDMRVDGSSTPQDFYVQADDEDDLYISQFSFVLADAGASFNEWGNTGGSLTNGCRMFYERSQGEVLLPTMTTNFEFCRVCQFRPSFGDAGSAFRASNVEGGSEAFIPIYDWSASIPPFGLKLSAGTKQRAGLRVYDNLASGGGNYLDRFDAIAYGFRRLPD